MHEQPNKVREIFEQVIAQDLSNQEQLRFVIEICDGDKAVEDEVIRLLEVDRSISDEHFLCWSIPSQNPRSTPSEFTVGDYRLIKLLGTGATGLVYQAHNKQNPESLFAVKLLRFSFQDSDNLKRFEVEKEVLSKLSHPGIANLVDHGSARDGTPFIVMEFVEGQSIEKFINLNSTSIADRITLFLQVAEAIGFAHEHGVLHRDLKPSNILVTQDARVVVTDFGISKLVGNENSRHSTITATGAVLGTPGYMAPEQFTSPKDVTTATDIFGLGALLYFLLTNQPPIKPAALSKMIMDLESQKIERPSKTNNLVESELDVVCLKCLEYEPANRYRSVAQLIDDANRYQSGIPILARQAGILESILRWGKRNKALATVILSSVMFLMIGASVVTYLLIQSSRQSHLLAKQQDELINIIDSQFTDAAEWIRKYPGANELSARLLESAIQHTSQIAKLDPTNKQSRIAVAESLFRAAKLANDTGDYETRDKLGAQSYKKFIDLKIDFPNELRFEFDVFHCQMLMHHHETAFKVISELTSKSDDPYYQDAYVACAVALATSDEENSELYFKKAYPVAKQLAEEHPDEPFFHRHFDRLTVLWKLNDLSDEQIIAHAKTALASILNRMRDKPADFGVIYDFRLIAFPAIEALLRQNDRESARSIAENLVELFEAARIHSPELPQRWETLAAVRAEVAFWDLFESDQDRSSFVSKAISELNAACVIWPQHIRLRTLKNLFVVEFFHDDPKLIADAKKFIEECPRSELYPFSMPVLVAFGKFDWIEPTNTDPITSDWPLLFRPVIDKRRGRHKESQQLLRELERFEHLQSYHRIKTHCQNSLDP